MNRRRFLRNLLGASALTLGFPPALKFAHAANGKTLVVVFQRGGCDGLNTVIPYGDNYYAGLRPTIGIAAPNGNNPDSALDLNGFFGLHPALAPLHTVYQQGMLAVMPAVHYPNSSHSHFDGQQFIESGAPNKTLDGWLNRHLDTHADTGVLRAVGFGSELPHALRGRAPAMTIGDIDSFGLGGSQEFANGLLDRMLQLYGQTPEAGDVNRALVHEQGNIMLDNLEVLSQIDASSYTPENGALYPNTSFGRQMRQIAQLIKEGVGLEVAALNIGGWDTHTNQGGAQGGQANRHAEFSGGIAALVQDLGSRMADVLVLTMTEFGRTAAENGSRGTDHGDASAWFAVGGNIKSGVHGAWPGLAPDELSRGRYLAPSIDYRDVLAEVALKHLGNDSVSDIVPGHTYTPIGIL